MKSSAEFQEVYPAAARAFVLIPQMYNKLTLVDGLTHKYALAKIYNGHVLPGFSPRNIRRYLPANNPNIPKRARASYWLSKSMCLTDIVITQEPAGDLSPLASWSNSVAQTWLLPPFGL
jgi:hypothetical protein